MISSRIIQTANKAEKYPHIKRIGVFGSYARDDAHTDSDLDILVDYDECTDEFIDELGMFMEDMELAFSCKIDWVTLPALMKGQENEFRQNVLRDVQWIYDNRSVPHV